MNPYTVRLLIRKKPHAHCVAGLSFERRLVPSLKVQRVVICRAGFEESTREIEQQNRKHHVALKVLRGSRFIRALF